MASNKAGDSRNRRSLVAKCLRSIAALLAVAALSLLVGVVVPRGGPAAGGDDGPPRRILVLKGPIHSDIALPADPSTRQHFAFLADAGLPLDQLNASWIIVGWGGRAFYTETPTWSDLRPMPVLRTLTGDAAALHVELAGVIDTRSPDVLAIDLSDKAYRDLVAAVLGSFTPGEDGRPREIVGAGYGEFDRFFEARWTFHLMSNCNSWTAAMLRKGGQSTGLWTPLPQALFLSLALHAD